MLAKGLAPAEAARVGVWLHAEAGRWGAEAFPVGLAAEDLIALVPRVMAGHIEERRPGWTD
jgi:NAD(P)H-hydrate repair Nnr-like enzyme with NAD(P)H-hydrate dehydratase domain